MTTPPSVDGFNDADYEQFQRAVESLTGVRLAEYKADQMRRRVATMAANDKHASFMGYARALQNDNAARSTFLQNITINVTELLRNPDRFNDLAGRIVPSLLARSPAELSVWSAGCSYGAEAFTLALLLHETVGKTPFRILGTDIDAGILAKAEQARFSEADMVNISPERRRAHFVKQSNGVAGAAPHLRARVRFARHDLLADAYPKAQYDLIACRNVLIYFTDAAKERIYQSFFRALKPGGVLFVGGTERLSDHRGLGFELVLPFFYQKPGAS